MSIFITISNNVNKDVFCKILQMGGGKRAVNFPKIGRVYQQSVFEKKTQRFAILTSKN